MSVNLLCFAAGLATAVACHLLVTGIRRDRARSRAVDQADTAMLLDLGERHSVWRTLASRGELPADPGYPPPPPTGEYRDPDEPDSDDEDPGDDEPVGAPPLQPGMVLPWRVLTLDALRARPVRAAARVDSPNDPLQPVVWAPWGRHRPEAVVPVTGDARAAYDEAAVLTHGHHGQHLTGVLPRIDDAALALFGGAGRTVRHHTRDSIGAAAA
jgi:hypothetical protein